MAKYSWMPKSANRKRRIIGRKINGKTLPDYVYRFDDRTPAIIRGAGFQAWNGGGDISLMEHVNNSYADGPKKAQQTKKDSQYVSTGGYGILKMIDPTFAQKIMDTYVYKIDTDIALESGNFVDVNDHFDRQGVDRPYATQREWLKLGGIRQEAVVEYMNGQTFALQLVDGVAPDEHLLQGFMAF